MLQECRDVILMASRTPGWGQGHDTSRAFPIRTRVRLPVSAVLVGVARLRHLLLQLVWDFLPGFLLFRLHVLLHWLHALLSLSFFASVPWPRPRIPSPPSARAPNPSSALRRVVRVATVLARSSIRSLITLSSHELWSVLADGDAIDRLIPYGWRVPRARQQCSALRDLVSLASPPGSACGGHAATSMTAHWCPVMTGRHGGETCGQGPSHGTRTCQVTAPPCTARLDGSLSWSR